MRSVLGLLAAFGIFNIADGQTANDPNEGSRLTYDNTYESYDFSWWGKAGRTYFIQQSDDLFSWEYIPIIESGYHDLLSWGFTSTAEKFFVRLRFSDIPTSDPYSADFDGDKISNYDELWAGTDPLKYADSDSDGIPDDWETYYGLDPNDPSDANLDDDGDGLSNLLEFQHGTYPNLADSDYDGLTDSQEIILGSDPLNYDTDENGVPDGEEDADGDGMPNQWEFDHQLNPIVSDGTLDPDSDGLNNLREFQHETNPHNSDSDSDGLSDQNEADVLLTDPAQYDTDGDGYNDGWEIRFGFNPLADDANNSDPTKRPDADSDGDGVTNLEEEQIDTNPANSDTDGDGYSDSAEAQGGSNPNNPASTPANPGGPGTSPSPIVPLSVTFGDPSGSHSEKYRVILTPLEGDPNTQTRYRTNQHYGQLQTSTFNLPKGAKYKVTLVHISTDPNYHDTPKPDYDYQLDFSGAGGGDTAVFTEDPQGMLGSHRESTPFFASGKDATLYIAWLTSETVATTPSNKKRTKVGVGEEVNLTVRPASVPNPSWSLTGTPGTSALTPSGNTALLEAGIRACTPSVEISVNGNTLSLGFDVVNPSGERATKTDLPFPAGTQGAGMSLDITTLPDDVSFDNVEVLEVDKGTQNVTGYFLQFPASALLHVPNPSWIQLTPANGWGDTASFDGWGTPWSSGTYEWKIEVRWRVVGKEAGQGAVLGNRIQTHTINDSTGKSTETKLGNSATRSP